MFHAVIWYNWQRACQKARHTLCTLNRISEWQHTDTLPSKLVRTHCLICYTLSVRLNFFDLFVFVWFAGCIWKQHYGIPQRLLTSLNKPENFKKGNYDKLNFNENHKIHICRCYTDSNTVNSLQNVQRVWFTCKVYICIPLGKWTIHSKQLLTFLSQQLTQHPTVPKAKIQSSNMCSILYVV